MLCFRNPFSCTENLMMMMHFWLGEMSWPVDVRKFSWLRVIYKPYASQQGAWMIKKISTCVTVIWMKTTVLDTFWKNLVFFSIKSTSGHTPSLWKHQHHHCRRWNILADAALLGRWCNSISISTVVPGDWLVSQPGLPLKSFQPRANQSPNELIFH